MSAINAIIGLRTGGNPGDPPLDLSRFDNAVIICDGNSLSQPGPAYGAGPEWLTIISNEAPFDSNGSTFHILGVGGATTQAMQADAVAQVDSLYTPGVMNILFAWEIGNDLFYNGNATNAYNDFVQYCQDRQAAGFKVIVLNVTPRDLTPTLTGAGDTWVQWQTKVDSVNALLSANWTDFADGFVDLASDSRLADPLDTTYYIDAVHQNGTGREVIAELCLPVLLALEA